MAIFENFPYTNIHELNLDWLIEIVKKYTDKTDNLEISYADLESYVKDYFDNLDVQDEVNQKLEQMYQSGQLAEIIAQYLQTQSLLVYQYVYRLKRATNLVLGSLALTMGTDTVNDGKSRLYYIRQVTTSDVLDNYEVVPLANYPNWVAQCVNHLWNEETIVNYSSLTDKNVLLIGDSFLGGTGASHGWGYYLKNKYQPKNCYEYTSFGGGFATAGSSNRRYDQLLDDAHATLSADKVDYVIIVGGYNDYQRAYNSNLLTYLNSFISKLKSYYPNSKYYFFANAGKLGTYRTTTYNGYARDCYNTIIEYLSKAGVACTKDLIWWTYHDTELCSSTDNVHLTDKGYELYADLINTFINGGDIEFHLSMSNSTMLSPLNNPTDETPYVSPTPTGPMVSRDGAIVNLTFTSWSILQDVTIGHWIIAIDPKLSPTYNLYIPCAINTTFKVLNIQPRTTAGVTGSVIKFFEVVNGGTALRLTCSYSLEV